MIWRRGREKNPEIQSKAISESYQNSDVSDDKFVDETVPDDCIRSREATAGWESGAKPWPLAKFLQNFPPRVIKALDGQPLR
jgi:hypothetical protein